MDAPEFWVGKKVWPMPRRSGSALVGKVALVRLPLTRRAEPGPSSIQATMGIGRLGGKVCGATTVRVASANSSREDGIGGYGVHSMRPVSGEPRREETTMKRTDWVVAAPLERSVRRARSS